MRWSGPIVLWPRRPGRGGQWGSGHTDFLFGRKLTQREFVLGLIEEALEAAERQAVEDIPEPEEEQPSEDAGVSPCEAQPEGGDTQPQEDGEPAVWGA